MSLGMEHTNGFKRLAFAIVRVVGDGARWLTRAIAVGEMHHAWRTNPYTNG